MAPFVKCAKIKRFYYLVQWVKYIIVQTVYYDLKSRKLHIAIKSIWKYAIVVIR